MADIRKRIGSNGVSWQARYVDKKSGKPRYKSFPRRKDADFFLSKVQGSEYVHDSDTVTVSEAADRWIAVCKKTGRKGREPVEGSTLRKYKEHARKIKSMIGGQNLNQLTPQSCNEFKDALLADYSRAYAKKFLTSFKSILSQARADGFLYHDPSESTLIHLSSRYAKGKRQEIPSVDEVSTLLKIAKDLANSDNDQIKKAWSRYVPFFYTLVFSGMRPCEVIGLPWKDVDFNKSTITITQDATELGEIGLPKSAASYRTIHMPAIAMHELKEWKKICPEGNLDLVFPNWSGKIESHANVTNRGWYRLQEACGFLDLNDKPKYPLKSLRHVRASLEIHNGGTAKEVQSLMGHSSIQITFDVYGHIFKDHDEERASRADLVASQLSSCGEFVAGYA